MIPQKVGIGPWRGTLGGNGGNKVLICTTGKAFSQQVNWYSKSTSFTNYPLCTALSYGKGVSSAATYNWTGIRNKYFKPSSVKLPSVLHWSHCAPQYANEGFYGWHGRGGKGANLLFVAGNVNTIDIAKAEKCQTSKRGWQYGIYVSPGTSSNGSTVHNFCTGAATRVD